MVHEDEFTADIEDFKFTDEVPLIAVENFDCNTHKDM
jgi:hypothetical protein